MNLRRVAAVARKSLSQFRHDRRTVGFILIMPLLMVLVFGYTFGGEVHDIRTLVVDEDAGSLAGAILGNVTGDTLRLEAWSSASAAREEIRSGRAWAAVVFNSTFSTDVLARRAEIIVILDGTSTNIVQAVVGKLRAAVEKTFAGSAGAPLSIGPEYVYGSEDTRFIDSFAPGVIALAVLMVTSIFSIIIIVREKSAGMLERLFATPLTAGEFVSGHAIALGVIALAQSAVVMGAALLIFGVQVAGSIALAFAVLLLFALGNQGLGIMLSSIARNELQAIQLVPLILFPSLLLTGVFFPLESIPGWLRPLSYAVPLTYASDALKSIMLRGWGPAEIALDLAALGLYTLLTLAGAALMVRRQA